MSGTLYLTSQSELSSPEYNSAFAPAGEDIYDVVKSGTSADTLSVYALTDAAIWVNPDYFGSDSFVSKQSISGYTLLRKNTTVAQGIGIYGGSTTSNPTVTQGFTSGISAPWYFPDATFPFYVWGPTDNGSWSATGGRTDAGCIVAGDTIPSPTRGEATVYMDLGQDSTVTAASFWATASAAGHSQGWRIKAYAADKSLVQDLVNEVGTSTASYIEKSWTGSVSGVRYMMFSSDCNTATAAHPAYLDDISITYTYENYNLIYSDDNADTITTTSVATGENHPVAADMDDFNLGVHVVSGARQIYYTTAYDGAVSLLSGLTGVDGLEEIHCVRIPYKILATQVENKTVTALQFIYATSGSTNNVQGISFNASTGAINAQSDMTPVIAGNTYRCIAGKNALAASGRDSRIILMLGEDVTDLGTTYVLRTTNGGATWFLCNGGVAVSYTSVTWEDNSASRVWFAGGTPGSNAGVALSIDGGVTLSSRSGDLPSNNVGGGYGGV